MSDLATGSGAGVIRGDAAGPIERTFLIADVRGYTSFTRQRGDAEAARLAKRFADIARDSVEARSGRVTELRGDEVLAVFRSPDQAVRAAVELQAACEEEVAADSTLPLLVGVGIDVGEAVPVEDGFRGAALNTAARLCSQAAAGQVLVTSRVADRAGAIHGMGFDSAGSAKLKGFEAPVELIEVVAEEPPSIAGQRAEVSPLPIELELDTPLVGREHELAWLRGTWRQARRGLGRLVFVSGFADTGKSRLVAEVADFAHSSGAMVSYAGVGGTGAALADSAVREAVAGERSTLVVLDDLDVTGEAVAPTLAKLLDAIEAAPILVVGLVRDPDAIRAVARLIGRADCRGDGHRRLGPLDVSGVREIARLYVGDDVQDVPLESIARASAGVPGRVHEVMSDWAEREATRRLAAAAEFLARERKERSADLEFANNVIGLKLARLYGGEESSVEIVAGECPYKGLASFEEGTPASSSVASVLSASWRREPWGPACSLSLVLPEAASRRLSQQVLCLRLGPVCCRGASAGARSSCVPATTHSPPSIRCRSQTRKETNGSSWSSTSSRSSSRPAGTRRSAGSSSSGSSSSPEILNERSSS